MIFEYFYSNKYITYIIIKIIQAIVQNESDKQLLLIIYFLIESISNCNTLHVAVHICEEFNNVNNVFLVTFITFPVF